MNFKFKGLILGTAMSALAFSGCQSAPVTTTNANTGASHVANNTAVVVPSNSNSAGTNANSNTAASNGNWNAGITREEWEKNKDEYANRAKQTGSTVGQGANDAWLWTKAKASLAAADDLRDSTINVDVENDVVTLKGTVANEAQKTKAAQVAKVEGVKSVKNELKVAAGDSVTNQMTGGNSSNSAGNANGHK